MLDNLWLVAQNVIMLFLLMMVGAACRKSKILNDEAVKCCANLILYIGTPCVIINSCIREYDVERLHGFLIVVAAAAANHIMLIIMARLVFRNNAQARNRIYRFAVVFSNCGYMAIPLQQVILPENGVFYCAAYIIVSNIFSWTYGITEMSGDIKFLSVKKLVLNPAIIGVVVGMSIFLLQIPIPYPISAAITQIGNLNTPIPMIIVGYYLASTDIKAAICDLKSWLCLFLRLAAAPLILLGICKLIDLQGDQLTAIIICAATPVAANTTMFATRFNCTPELSVNLVSLSTLISVLTMPLLVSLAL